MGFDLQQGAFARPSTLVDLLTLRAHTQGNDTAYHYLVYGDDDQPIQELSYTYAELDRRARAIGAWLEAHQLTGQNVLLLFPPGLDFIAAFFGCLYAGVVAVTAYPPRRNRSLDRIQSIVEDADAKVALTTDTVLNRIQPLLEQTPNLKQLRWLAVDQVPAGLENDWRYPAIASDTLAFLQYTSGSTGTPKGVMLSHSNLLHNSALIAYAFEHTRSISGVFWLPCYHDMGLVGGILQPLYLGTQNVLMSPMAFLQRPLRWLQAITRYGATTSGGPNFAFDLCARKITEAEKATLDLSSWKVAFNGAEPVREETLARFSRAFACCGFRPQAFYPCYGLAEATLLVSGGLQAPPPVVRSFDAKALEQKQVQLVAHDAPNGRRLVSSGHNLPDQRIVIVDPETSRSLPANQIGEIWVSGPSVAQGYWKRPQESQATFGARLADEPDEQRTYLRTGDLGFLDQGELFVSGRKKDLIIVRGVNYYPQDIELTVDKCHPGVRHNAGAAFTVEMAAGQQLVIVQEVERTAMREAPAIIEAIRRAVAEQHELQLDSIVLIKPGSVAKTSSGKIQRHACREGYRDGSLLVVAQWRRGETEVSVTGRGRGARTILRADRSATVLSAENGHTDLPVNTLNGNGHHKHGHEPRTAVNGHAAYVANGNGHSANGTAVHEAAPQTIGTLDAGRQLPADVVPHVLRLVVQVAGPSAQGASLETSLADLGLDSLARIELQSAIEDYFGGRLPEEVALSIESLSDIVSAVEAHLGRPAGPRRTTDQVPPDHYQVDQFPEYLVLKQNLLALADAGLKNPYFSLHERVCRDTTIVDGRPLINFSSYNYVGMSGDPVVSAAAKAAIDRYGTSVSASRLASGEKPIHQELERAIAEFLGVESAIVFVGGHSTNETTIGHLFGPGDLILHDALSHNSIVQGAVLSGARRRPFPHNDWRALDKMLADLRGDFRRVLVVIEGVYSMDGDIADLPQFIEVKRQHRALLMVDEAHSAGTLGAHGRGIAEHFGLRSTDVDLWMGTLSKTYASCGGYIAGSHSLVEYLKYTAPGFVFSVGIPPASAAAALASLRVLESEPERVARLQANSRLFLQRAQERGLNTGLSHDTPVVPVILGSSLNCLRLSRALFERGINVQPILYPAVEESTARLRFFITCLHTEEQIRSTVDAVVEELTQLDPSRIRPPHTSGEVPAPAFRLASQHV